MYRFDLYCKNCGYENEHILNHSSDRLDCPLCGSKLEKAAGGCNISTSKTRPKDIPEEISTPFGRATHIWGVEFDFEFIKGRVDLYETRNSRLGDPELN
jgi:ribosomal protein S27E